MQKLLIIVGPTASGKSALGVELAKRFDGEILSADSRQVYRGLDIGTGKVTDEEKGGIPHHLLDVVDPTSVFTAGDFVRMGRAAISDIASRHTLPIVVGGTGFYIDALTGVSTLPEVPPNEALRKELSHDSAEELFKKLSSIDPRRSQAMNTESERSNRPRLIRAIEVATALGAVPPTAATSPLYNTLSLGLKPDMDVLRRRIHGRLLSRIENGMIQEAERLRDTGLSLNRMRELGLEYRWLADYLEGRIPYDQFVSGLERDILAYARRQIGYAKRNPSIVWLQYDHALEDAVTHIRAWLAE